MRYLFVLLLLLASSAIATDDGIKLGSGNEDADVTVGITSAVGPIYQFGDAADIGEYVDSAGVFLRITAPVDPTKTVRVALYQWNGTNWNRVDTCAPTEVDTLTANQWTPFNYLLGHEMFPSDDNLYSVQIVSDGGSGEEYITEVDSAAFSYTILGGNSEKGSLYGNVGIGDAWPATLSGYSYGRVDSIPTAWIYYGMVEGTDSLIVSDSIAPDGWQDVGGASRVSKLADNATSGYIQCNGDNDPDTAGVGIQNTSLTDSEIDSVSVHWNYHHNGFAAGDVRVDILVGGTRSTGTVRSVSNGAGTFEEIFSDVPGGSGWTQAQVNGITVEMLAVSVGALDDVKVRWLYIEVYFTSAATGAFIIIGD